MTSIRRVPVHLPLQPAAQSSSVQKTGQESFANVLRQTQQHNGIRFSEHAMMRLRDRHIELSEQDHAKIRGAVERAAQKGARDSLLLMNDVALVVSVKNRTVVTALDQREQSEKVFTNIDSAVIIL